MSKIDRIESRMTHLPPAWISRKTGSTGNLGNATEVRKMMGEPIPQKADLSRLPPHVAEMFDSNGILERLAKKLKSLSRKKHKKIIPARNTICCVDDEENIYVGVDFLEKYGDDEDLLAGILAHEWGHMISDLPKGKNWAHLTWSEIHELRREEEAYADGYAGRALYMMGYKPKSMMSFLKTVDKKRNQKIPNFKYHNTATRVAILQASFEAQERAFAAARKFFGAKKFIGQG